MRLARVLRNHPGAVLSPLSFIVLLGIWEAVARASLVSPLVLPPPSRIWAQDRACTEGMGAIMDRTQEHLVASDATLVQTRRLLIAAANALRERGTPPPGLGLSPPIMASPTAFLPKSLSWEELSKDYVHGKMPAPA